MKRAAPIAFAALVSLSLPGCWFTDFWDDDTYWEDDDAYPWANQVVRDARFERLDGELGGHDLTLREVQGQARVGSETQLTVESTVPGTWLLFQLSVGADLWDADLGQGRVFTSSTDSVSLMGCTGERPYDFDYDGFASRVEVTVLQDEGSTRTLLFTATFDDAGRSRDVTGTVRIELDDATRGTSNGSRVATRVHFENFQSDLGDQGSYELSAVEGVGYTDGYTSSVEFETESVGQWVLFRLSTNETDLFAAEVGETIEGAELMGCSGDAPYEFDYDGYAAETQVDILAGDFPNERIARIRGRFETEWGPQSVDTEVRYEVW